MKLLTARYVAGAGYRFRVWLDTTRVGADGVSPDPEWVVRYQFGEQPPPGVDVATYRTQMQNRVKELAQLALAEKLGEAAGTAMPAEGGEI